MKSTRFDGRGFAETTGMGTTLDRRAALKWTAGSLVAATALSRLDAARGAEPAADGMIVRSLRPLDLESPVAALDSWLTPNNLFFVRSHFGAPALGLFPWTTELGGLVDRPASLTLNDFSKYETHAITAVLQCAGNGRGFFRPRIPGVGWEKGAVGHARWEGARLADVLNRAGIQRDAAHVHILGADGPPAPKTPLFFRSIPLDKALHPDTILATRMNGLPIPAAHGGPVRLVVPGWTGNHWMKWVRWVTIAANEAPGFYMQTGYRLPRASLPPGTTPKPADMVPVTTMNVKSLITWPAAGATLPPGRHEVRGVAWTGEGHVTKVEVGKAGAVGFGGGPGFFGERLNARFLDDAAPWSWRRWRCTVELKKGDPVTLRAQATDSRGETQPIVSPYNKSGYLWNGLDGVTVKVG